MAGSKSIGRSRRGFPRYHTNPSIDRVKGSMSQGTRAIQGKTGDKWMVVNEDTGEARPAGFHQRVPVDSTRFVKIFIEGVRSFMGLSPSAARLFEHIFSVVSEHPSNDRLVLSFMEVQEQNPGIQMRERTFHRAMHELLEAEIIYESTTPNLYWLNIEFMFNGDRLAFVKEYVREEAVAGGRATDHESEDNERFGGGDGS